MERWDQLISGHLFHFRIGVAAKGSRILCMYLPDNVWRVHARPNLQRILFQRGLSSCAKALAKMFWSFQVTGTEFLPREGPYIVAANHVSYLDPFLVGMCVPVHPHFMATDDLFRKPLLRILLSLFGAFPAKRYGVDVSTVSAALRLLRQKRIIGIFPERTRTWDGQPVPLDDRACRFLYRAGVPVIAARIEGAYHAYPRWAKTPGWAPITVHFFHPLIPDNYESPAQFKRALAHLLQTPLKDARPARRYAPFMHRGLSQVLWRCISCGAERSVQERVGRRLVCSQCGRAWLVKRDLTLAPLGQEEGDKGGARRGVVRLAKARFRSAGPLHGSDQQAGMSIAWWHAAIVAATVSELKKGVFPSPVCVQLNLEKGREFTPVGQVQISLHEDGVFLADLASGRRRGFLQYADISATFITGKTRLGLVVDDTLYQLVFSGGSALQYQECIDAMRRLVPAQDSGASQPTEITGLSGRARGGC